MMNDIEKAYLIDQLTTILSLIDKGNNIRASANTVKLIRDLEEYASPEGREVD